MDELKMFDIVYADFTESKVGSEQSGIHPYVIIQNNIGNKYLTPNKNIKILVKNHKIYFLNQR